MKRNAVGFYWTLPVPWAGFADLPVGIDEAAKASRTIRFQRQLIRRYTAENGLALVHEAAFLEIDPDRGSDLIHEALDRAAAVCREHRAVLLFVDFSGVQGWRSHEPMTHWLREAQVDSMPIEAAPIEMDGGPFDPHEHFAIWRQRQRGWIEGKAARAEKAFERIKALKASGLSYPEIATRLNVAGVRSLSGKNWTGEGVRKFLSGRS